MITTTKQSNGSYVTLTWPMYRIQKNDRGWWYNSLDGTVERVGWFVQKKQALEHLENMYAPRPTHTGQQRIKIAKHKDTIDSVLMTLTGYNRAYWESYVDRTAREMWSWCAFFYGLSLNMEVKQTYSTHSRNSVAFNSYIRIRPLSSFKHKVGSLFYYHEYRHIINDPDIGAFHTSDPHKIILGVLCHEIAHIIQVNTTIRTGFTKAYSSHGVRQGKWHDKDWQTIYHRLKVQFMPECTDMGNELPRVIL